MKEIKITPLPTKEMYEDDNFAKGIFVGVAICLAVLALVTLITITVVSPASDKYITQDAKVSAVYWDELHNERIVTLQDEDGEEWQVYNDTLRLGNKVEMRRDTKETPELSDDEIIWAHKK